MNYSKLTKIIFSIFSLTIALPIIAIPAKSSEMISDEDFEKTRKNLSEFRNELSILQRKRFNSALTASRYSCFYQKARKYNNTKFSDKQFMASGLDRDLYKAGLASQKTWLNTKKADKLINLINKKAFVDLNKNKMFWQKADKNPCAITDKFANFTINHKRKIINLLN
tara:strand:+ start:330 stop:833 length:504 start_codon:yes stop_codon:yes gene_type:complete